MSEQVKREAISAFSAGKQLGDNPYPSSSKEASVWSATWTAEKLKSRRTQNQAFQTGAARATAAIMNKAASVGVRVGNSNLTQDGYIEVACVTQYPGEGKFETLEEGPSAEWIFDKLKKQMRGGKLPVYVEVKGGVHGNLKWGA